MHTANKDIRLEILGAGLKFWQVAHELGISSSALSVRLRQELDGKEKARIRTIIQRLKKEGGNRG